MIEQYRLIVQDTFKNLEVGKIYNIKDNRYIVSDNDETIILYGITQYQLQNMFKKI